MGLTAERALNRRFVLHVSGQETFNRGFQVRLNFLWGKDKRLGY